MQLPALSVTTAGKADIVDKETYLDADMTLTPTDGSAPVTATLQIKGHGNSTWGLPKKSYRLKLNDKAGLLGMPKDKNWVLIANYSDKTLLRNRTAFQLSRRLGMAWTPRIQPVELTLNGVYMGAYDLVEEVRVDKNRVNVTEIDDTTSGDPADGGYLVEVNELMDDNVCWRTTRKVAFCIKDPDPSTPGQAAYIKDYIQTAEDALFSGNLTNPTTGYANYIDVDSLIDWYLIEELFKNTDSGFLSSVYIYKDKGGKLTFGPVWDFDISAGNTDYIDSTPQGFWTDKASWIARLKQADPTFEARVRARWKAIKAKEIDTLPAYIDARAAELAGAEQRNFNRWPIIGVYVWPNAYVGTSYQDEVDHLKTWLTQRTAWMDANL